jgi:hypothetical protein
MFGGAPCTEKLHGGTSLKYIYSIGLVSLIRSASCLDQLIFESQDVEVICACAN